MTTEEIIHVFEHSQLVSYNFTQEAITAAYVEVLAALGAQQEVEKQSPCSRCGYGGKHLDAPPCTRCPAHPKEAEDNAPLTLDELRGMDGEPVWVVCTEPQRYDNAAPTGWRILESSITGKFGVWAGKNNLIERDYGKTWLAYRHKPEEDK